MGARRGRSVGRHWWVGPRGAGRSCGGGSGGVAAAAAGLERSGGERRGAGREVAAPPGPMELENIVANTVLLKAREGERFPSSGRRPRWGGRPGAGRAALRPGAGGQGLPAALGRPGAAVGRPGCASERSCPAAAAAARLLPAALLPGGKEGKKSSFRAGTSRYDRLYPRRAEPCALGPLSARAWSGAKRGWC